MQLADATTPFTRAIARLAIVIAVVFALSVAAASGAYAADGGVGPAVQQADDPQASSSKAKYNRLWQRVSVKDKRWAEKTARCESGGDPDAIGGGGIYRGAFQFMRSTWKSSPKSPGGDPINFNYRTQAVVAVALKRRDGDGHWPVCG